MTTIRIDRDTTKEDLDKVKELEGHSSLDSAIKSLLNDHKRVNDLEEKVDRLEPLSELAPGDGVVDVYDRLNLDAAQPIPEPVGWSLYNAEGDTAEDIPRLFRLFINSQWTLNTSFAHHPEYIDIVLTQGGFIFHYFGGVSGAGAGRVFFFVDRGDYEDELLRMLDADVEFLAPPGGFDTSTAEWDDTYECIEVDWGGSQLWPVLGGYGREVSESELNRLLGLRTVDEAILEDGQEAYDQYSARRQDTERKNESRSERGEPMKAHSGIHVDKPTDTLSEWWDRWANSRADWKPRSDINLDDLLPESAES